MTLILHDMTAWHWAIGGAAIGLFVLALQFLANRSFGISTGFESLCALGSRASYFQRKALQGTVRWRLWFFGGLLLGGVLSAVAGGGWSPSWDLGRFDQWVSESPWIKTGWMVMGGFLIGFGTRLAGGCTSGHGIFGVATFQKASFVAVASFMAAGILTANIMYRWGVVG